MASPYLHLMIKGPVDLETLNQCIFESGSFASATLVPPSGESLEVVVEIQDYLADVADDQFSQLILNFDSFEIDSARRRCPPTFPRQATHLKVRDESQDEFEMIFSREKERANDGAKLFVVILVCMVIEIVIFGLIGRFWR